MSYFVSKDVKGLISVFEDAGSSFNNDEVLEWTTEPPTEGYYWVEAKYYHPIESYSVAKIRFFDGEEWNTDIVDDDFEVGRCMGPLPVPELPN